jgi:hypothetical protein
MAHDALTIKAERREWSVAIVPNVAKSYSFLQAMYHASAH